MSHSHALLLPFGALTGVIPIDAVRRGRELGVFGNPTPSGHPTSQSPVFAGSDPACAASPPSPIPSGDGGS